MMLKDGKKMSTRKGKVVLLEEVLSESIAMATHSIEAKNPHFQIKMTWQNRLGLARLFFTI